MSNIYTAINNIMSEIGAISKDKKNATQGFMYRGIDDVMNALQPLLSKYKVFIVPEVLEQIREERTSNKGAALIYSICKMKYTFYADDGTSVSAIVIGEGMDSGDKATNKAMAIAMKYACFQVFCIPTEEMKDPDAESHEVSSQNELTDEQVKKLFDIAKKKGYDAKKVKEILLKKFKVTEAKKLTKEQYDKAYAGFESLEDKAGK